MSKTATAYTIIKEIGIADLRDLIHKTIPEREFDSHRFIEHFLSRFPRHFERMMDAHLHDGCKKFHSITNRIGIFLWKHRTSLGIEKIGTRISQNIACHESRSSLWRKIE